MVYIEENMKKRRGDATQEEEDEGPRDPFEELYRPNKNSFSQKRKTDEEGNVTNSMAMLTAILLRPQSIVKVYQSRLPRF